MAHRSSDYEFSRLGDGLGFYDWCPGRRSAEANATPTDHRDREAIPGCASRERRRDDVAIPGVDLVRDGGCEAAGLVCHRLGEGRLHALAPAAEPFFILRPVPDQARDELIEDLGAPGRTAKAALREAWQQIADDGPTAGS